MNLKNRYRGRSIGADCDCDVEQQHRSGDEPKPRSVIRRFASVLKALVLVPSLVFATSAAMAQTVDLVLNHEQSIATINATDTATFTVTVDNSDPTHTG